MKLATMNTADVVLSSCFLVLVCVQLVFYIRELLIWGPGACRKACRGLARWCRGSGWTLGFMQQGDSNALVDNMVARGMVLRRQEKIGAICRTYKVILSVTFVAAIVDISTGNWRWTSTEQDVALIVQYLLYIVPRVWPNFVGSSKAFPIWYLLITCTLSVFVSRSKTGQTEVLLSAWAALLMTFPLSLACLQPVLVGICQLFQVVAMLYLLSRADRWDAGIEVRASIMLLQSFSAVVTVISAVVWRNLNIRMVTQSVEAQAWRSENSAVQVVLNYLCGRPGSTASSSSTRSAASLARDCRTLCLSRTTSSALRTDCTPW